MTILAFAVEQKGDISLASNIACFVVRRERTPIHGRVLSERLRAKDYSPVVDVRFAKSRHFAAQTVMSALP